MGDVENILEQLVRKIIKWFIALFGTNLVVIGIIALILSMLFFFVGFLDGGSGDLVGENVGQNGAAEQKLDASLETQYKNTADTYWKTTPMTRTIRHTDGSVERRDDLLSPDEIKEAEGVGVKLSWGLLASVSKLYNNFKPTMDQQDVPYISPLLPVWQDVDIPSGDGERDTVVEWPMEIITYGGIQTFHIEYRESGKKMYPVLVPDPFKQDYSRLMKLLKARNLQNDMDLVMVTAYSFDPSFTDPDVLSLLPQFSLSEIFSGSVNLSEVPSIINGSKVPDWWPDIVQESQMVGIDPLIVASVMTQESGGRPDAHSPAGAIGLMQLMPDTARGLGVDPYDPKQNIYGGAEDLSGLLKEYNGSLPLALAAYNWGTGHMQNHGIYTESDLRQKWGELPAETQNYVTIITGIYDKLKKLNPTIGSTLVTQ